MNTDTVNKILAKIVDNQATGEILIDASEALSLKADSGELEEHSVTSSQIIGLRIVKDSRVGLAYSEASDEESLNQLLQQALTNASYGEANEFEKISPLQHHLQTDDKILAPEDNTSINEKIDFILSLESQLCKKDKIQKVPYNSLSDRKSKRSAYSTTGLVAHSNKRVIGAGAYALAADGDVNAMAHFSNYQRLFSGLDRDEIIEKTWQECMSRLSGAVIPTKHYDVIFNADQQAALFGVFKFALSGRAAKDGLNPWRDQIGNQVADKRIQLFDKPLLTEGMAYQLFDVEGTPCTECTIIKNGELNSLLHNTATANYFGVENTAHAARSPKTVLGVSPHQLVLTANQANDHELNSGEYLYITDLTGMHSGANTISGDFSFGASGYLCRDGERVQSVRGITIAGNFYQMLNDIVAIGETNFWNQPRSACMAPLRFHHLAISGS